MRVNSISKISFTRAFTTAEKAEYKKAQEEARKELGIEKTSAIVFDFNMPRGKYDLGLGNLNSESAQNLINFVKDESGINKIQLAPQGALVYSGTKPIHSPYSATNFGLGIHTVDVLSLAKKEYGSIVSPTELESADKKLKERCENIDFKSQYDLALGENKSGLIYSTMYGAYRKFLSGKNNPLKPEFEDFKNNLSEQETKNIIYEAIAQEYIGRVQHPFDCDAWNDRDKYLYTDMISDDERNKRISGLGGVIDYITFCAFIAHKQHQSTKERLNSQGIEVFGDIPVCFSKKEIWANPECFMPFNYVGGKDPSMTKTNGIQPWGANAINYDDLGEYDENGKLVSLKNTGKLLYDKFKHYLQLYDGVRMDAFWQYVNPFIYDNNMKGYDVEPLGDKIIQIIQKAADDSGKDFSKNHFTLELVGYNTLDGIRLTKNKIPHIYSSAYAQYHQNPSDLKTKEGYIDGFFEIGTGTHDNQSLINIVNNGTAMEHKNILKNNLGDATGSLGFRTQEYELLPFNEKIKEDLRTAKASEIFTAKRQFFTLTDFFGMDERINVQGRNNDNNWSIRLPKDFERFYYSQLSKGYGFNMPKIYEVALKAKESKNSDLIKRMERFSEILRKKGPCTTKEADYLEKQGRLRD